MFNSTSAFSSVTLRSFSAWSLSIYAKSSRTKRPLWTFILLTRGIPCSLYAALPPRGVAPEPSLVQSRRRDFVGHLGRRIGSPNISTNRDLNCGATLLQGILRSLIKPTRTKECFARLPAANVKKTMRGYPHRLLAESLLCACASKVACLNAGAHPLDPRAD